MSARDTSVALLLPSSPPPPQYDTPLPSLTTAARATSQRNTKLLLVLSCVFFSAVLTVFLIAHYPPRNSFTITAHNTIGHDQYRYQQCLATFANRQHSDNDGVSVRIGIHSVWNKIDRRNLVRETLKRWVPVPVNFHDHCSTFAASSQLSIKDARPSVSQRVDSRTCGNENDSDAVSSNDSGIHSGIELDVSWWSPFDNVEIVFVMGSLSATSPDYTKSLRMLELEQSLHGDLLVLPIIENMDDGKSLAHFRAQSDLNRAKKTRPFNSTRDYDWDYVMKLDDDSFLHIGNFVNTLRTFRRQRLREVYFGQYFPYPSYPITNDPRHRPSNVISYHSGAGYLLSIDLVNWLNSEHSWTIINNTKTVVRNAANNGDEPVVLPNTVGRGIEDLTMSVWLRERGRSLLRDQNPQWQGFSNDREEAYRLHHALVYNFINGAPNMYNIPHQRDYYGSMPQFLNSTILVHGLKDSESWAVTLNHFLCHRSHTFNVSNQWWNVDNHARLLNRFDRTGNAIPSRNWWNDWGQNYRHRFGNYTTPQ